MTDTISPQWIRKVGLFLSQGDKGLDLSAFRIRFNVQNADIESPNNAVIRVYNLSKETMKQKKLEEYTEVILNAGYEGGNYGIIFKGQIKQYKVGRESATDMYLDIFASDGDIGYNQGIVNTSLAAGATPAEAIKAAVASMPGLSSDLSALTITKQNVPNIRGTVLMGMARARLRDLTTHLDSGWSIQDGVVVVTDNTGYRDGEAVKININTGMIGMPEQTGGGIKVQCLLNSRIRIGGRVQLNNAEIIQLFQQNPDSAPIAYNQWSGFLSIAALSPDGMYRTFSVEHEGDTRGNTWQTSLICLAVNETVPANQSVNPD